MLKSENYFGSSIHDYIRHIVPTVIRICSFVKKYLLFYTSDSEALNTFYKLLNFRINIHYEEKGNRSCFEKRHDFTSRSLISSAAHDLDSAIVIRLGLLTIMLLNHFAKCWRLLVVWSRLCTRLHVFAGLNFPALVRRRHNHCLLSAIQESHSPVLGA